MNNAVILTPPPTHWVCSHCPAEDVTPASVPNRFHSCRGLAGITAPMVPAGLRCKVEVREREEYVGREDVQYDGNRRPVMSVVTTRDDGQDCLVLAPCAIVRMVN